MSYVSIVASTEWASIRSDCRLIEVSDSGKQKILPANKPSFFKISKKQLIACTGSASLLRQLKKDYCFQKRAYPITPIFLDDLKKRAAGYSSELQDVVIAFVNAAEGELTCQMITNEQESDWKFLVPDANRLAMVFMAGKEIDKQEMAYITKLFKEYLEVKEKTPTGIADAQKEIIRYVAGVDPLVSPQSVIQLIRG